MAEVAPKCLRRSKLVEKKKRRWFEIGAYVAIREIILISEIKRRGEKEERRSRGVDSSEYAEERRSDWVRLVVFDELGRLFLSFRMNGAVHIVGRQTEQYLVLLY